MSFSFFEEPLNAISEKCPLLLPYGLTCLTAHVVLYGLFRFVLPSAGGDGTGKNGNSSPWKLSPSLTAHRVVAFCAMNHWCYLGFKHVFSFDFYGNNGGDDDGDGTTTPAALRFVPAGYEIAQRVMGALACWDIPLSLIGGTGPTDVMMHLHHAGMVVVTACALGWIGASGGPPVGTHVAPIFLGAIELSSIPLQIVDLFHPKKSPHWFRYVNDDNNNASSSSSASFFPRLCSTANEVSRTLFAALFLLVRGLYFPFVVATIAMPDFYKEGSVPSMVLLVMSALFTLLQMYWATLVVGQVKKALLSPSSSGGGGKKEK